MQRVDRYLFVCSVIIPSMFIWCMHDKFSLKQAFSHFNLASTRLLILFNMILVNILPSVERSAIPLHFLQTVKSPFFVYFYQYPFSPSIWNLFGFPYLSKSGSRASVTNCGKAFRICTFILQGPDSLHIFISFIHCIIYFLL